MSSTDSPTSASPFTPSWDSWFEAQYEICGKVEALVQEKCSGKSRPYRVAVYAAILESISEQMRVHLDLPDSDADVEVSDGT